MTKKPDDEKPDNTDKEATELTLTLAALKQDLQLTSPNETLAVLPALFSFAARATVATVQPNEPEKNPKGRNKPKWRARKRRAQGHKPTNQD